MSPATLPQSDHVGYMDRGDHGMFMNTEYDTWENLCGYYPGRAQEHFDIYSPLLSALLYVHPESE